MLKHLLAFAVAFCLSPEPCKKMTKQTIVAFDRERFCFRLDMHVVWDKVFVRLPEISHHKLDLFVFKGVPQFFTGCCATVAQYAVDEFFPISINSKPDPAVVFLEEI